MAIGKDLHDYILERDPLCLWCVYRKEWLKEDIEVSRSMEVHHAVVKRLYGKGKSKLRKMTERKENLVGVCSPCHYKRLVDTHEAKLYFWWYLESHLGYDMTWYDELPMRIRPNYRGF